MENNERTAQICSCFDEIVEVLLEMEKEIGELYVCSPDDVDISVERINRYREITDELFAGIDSLCAEDETGELKKATEPLTDRKDVAEEYAVVFEKRQEVNAVAYRISAAIPMVQDRLKKSMDRVLEEIRENNSGQSAKAARFYSAVNETQGQGDRVFTQKSRII
ncbi:hypothetical protein [Ruminococcus sp. HUN007]|uniref:hypothetical protein n=1 Tax=Ruminococcus sp. HUN007 TaxID=1514668 RepID=UPI0005D19BA4|nr:hypothetical protein [Ruminococcus sp. HUN007]